MAFSKLWEMYYTVIKTTSKGNETCNSECYVEAESLGEAIIKFNKNFPPKRGYVYEITDIHSHSSKVIK